MDVKLARSLTYLLTPSKITCDKIAGAEGGRGPKRDIHLTFSGPRLQRGYRCYVTITKPRCARQQNYSCCFVIALKECTFNYWSSSSLAGVKCLYMHN